MLGVVSILQRLRGEAWVGNFVRGLTPALAILMAIVAWQILRGEGAGIDATTLVIALVSLAALLLRAPAPLVLFGAGLLGVILFNFPIDSFLLKIPPFCRGWIMSQKNLLRSLMSD